MHNHYSKLLKWCNGRNLSNWNYNGKSILYQHPFCYHSTHSSPFSSKSNYRPFTIEESLYLAKEAGIQTPWESHTEIMRSPPFSRNTDPFLLENFFSTIEKDDIQISEDEDRHKEQVDFKKNEHKPEEFNDTTTSQSNNENNQELIYSNFTPYFSLNSQKTFLVDGKEWMYKSEGKGTSKRASAHVIIIRGTGQIRVNKDEDLYAHWPYYYNRMDIVDPFLVTKVMGMYDLFIKTKGGGISGQSRAVRLAVGRALANACPTCTEELEKENILYEDKRQKMPKMPGRLAARKMKSWSKR